VAAASHGDVVEVDLRGVERDGRGRLTHIDIDRLLAGEFLRNEIGDERDPIVFRNNCLRQALRKNGNRDQNSSRGGAATPEL